MGNCFSDPSKDKGQRLGSAPQSAAGTPSQQGNAPNRGRASSGAPPQALGGTPSTGDGRSAALAAAEARAQAASSKGVSKTNAKSGQLSAKLEAERRQANQPTDNRNERMMDAGQWN